MKKTVLAGIIITALLLIFTMGCSQPEGDIYTDKVEVEGITIEEEAVPLSAAPAAVPDILEPKTGDKEKNGGGATIDYSNLKDG